VRVAVLVSSYEGSNSRTKDVDCKAAMADWTTPALNYQFEEVLVKKAESYHQVRHLAASGKYDVFLNLCDGAKDEDRAGDDVIRAMESLNLAFTGADSRGYEPSKVDMKMLATAAGIRTPNFAVLDAGDTDVAKACAHLRFPVIVKHISGYGSVGITRDSKCHDMKTLVERAKRFVAEFDVALVEEFVTGREGTVLVCADPRDKYGVHVFPPLLTAMPGGAEDFAHFENKWFMNNDKEMKFEALPIADSAYSAIVDMARNSFIQIMGGVGYGRCDFRIDDATNLPYFLEINANCGMFAEKSTGGDYADMMVDYDKDWDHDDFVRAQCQRALSHQAARTPWWSLVYNAKVGFSTKAARYVDVGTRIFADPIRPVPVVARALFRHGPLLKEAAAAARKLKPGDEPVDTAATTTTPHPALLLSLKGGVPVSCAVFRADERNGMVLLRHSCRPNCSFVHSTTLELATNRRVRRGEALTLDYATMRDMDMPPFRCTCGEATCRRIIRPFRPKFRLGARIPLRARRAMLEQQQQQQQQQQQVAGSEVPPASAASTATTPSSAAANGDAAAAAVPSPS
jgi:D-alanine-D-alanine ligase-like ATP-grasp enzyme